MTRDLDAIDSELRLAAAMRTAARLVPDDGAAGTGDVLRLLICDVGCLQV